MLQGSVEVEACQLPLQCKHVEELKALEGDGGMGRFVRGGEQPHAQKLYIRESPRSRHAASAVGDTDNLYTSHQYDSEI